MEGRKGKEKSKRKRKYMTSSYGVSSSSSASSESDTHDDDRDTSRRYSRRTATKPSKSFAANPQRKYIAKQLAIFQRHYSELETMISMCVDTVSNKLFSKGLISDNVLGLIITGQDSDRKKASKVLHIVRNAIKVNPEKLKVFVDILKEERSLKDLTKGMSEDLTKEIMSEDLTKKIMSECLT